MSEKRETVLAVHGNADGYWYIGAGKSIAEGPYRKPDPLLTVASDLLATEPHWRIDVFDVAGNKIISYSSDDLNAGDLHPLHRQHRWGALANATAHTDPHLALSSLRADGLEHPISKLNAFIEGLGADPFIPPVGAVFVNVLPHAADVVARHACVAG